jgi:hypothetical protein
MSEILILLISIGLAFLFVWFFAYRPFINIQKDLSISIIEEIVPDIKSSHNLITTLSASAIVLSFTVLQAFNTQKICNSQYLEYSWYLFVFAILFGTFAGIIIYIFKATSSVAVRMLRDHDDNKDIDKKKLEYSAKMKRRHQRMLFGFLLAQSVSFVAAIALFVAFAKNNLR